jgi:dihydroorotate dehydrogenase
MTVYIAAPFGNYIKTKKTRSVIGTFTLERRTGLLKQIITTLRYKNGAWYNAIGLRNPGIGHGLQHYDRSRGDVLSIAAIQPADWKILSNILPEDIDVELNLSCPNIDHFDDYTKDIDLFLNQKRMVIAKLSPKTTAENVKELLEMGFTNFHCCNTLPTKDGGMSGKKLMIYVDRLVRMIKHFSADTHIIAGGGIETIEDIERYKALGASSFSLGTVCFNPIKLYKVLHDDGSSSRTNSR